MHEILIILLVLVAGIFIGHNLWPPAKSDAAPSITARGKMPASPEESGIDVRQTELLAHGRVHPGAPTPPSDFPSSSAQSR